MIVNALGHSPFRFAAIVVNETHPEMGRAAWISRREP